MEHLDHPSPHFNDAKMARFLLLRAFIIAWGGWEIIVPFYTVQDCSSVRDFGKYSRGCSRTVSVWVFLPCTGTYYTRHQAQRHF